MIKVCVFTGSRADFDRLQWVCKAIQANRSCRLILIAGHAHLSRRYGRTIEHIRAGGWNIADTITMMDESNIAAAMARSIAAGTDQLVKSLTRLKPDVVVVLGDRFELLAVSNVCVTLNIPLAHIGGGQVTEGAIDNQIRNMVTKAAHLHFAANREFAQRITQMGEEPWRIRVTGSPSIDAAVNTLVMSCEELSREIDLDMSQPTALVTYHPTTLDGNPRKNNREFFAALRELDMQLLLTYPNSDYGAQEIIKELKNLQKSHVRPSILVKSLGNARYINSLRYGRLMIGNSSSGLIEAPSFNMPVVNVGSRQDGRPRANNVFDTRFDKHAILKAVHRAMRFHGKTINPWGKGHASVKIVDGLVAIFNSHGKEKVLRKKFFDA